MTLQELLSHLEGVKKIGGNEYAALCPSHNDTKPSLHVTSNDTGIAMHCKCGCSIRDITEALGLTVHDLYFKEQEPPKEINPDIEAIYNYGTYVKARFKTPPGAPKKIRYGTLSPDGKFISGAQDTERTIYNKGAFEKVRSYISQPYIYYVEGEKDVETLRKLGLFAVTAGGASDWKRKFAPLFKGQSVRIIPDNDKPGKTLAEEVQRDIRQYAWETEIVLLPETDEKEDVTDWIQKGHTKEELKNIEVKEENKTYGAMRDKKGALIPDNLALLALKDNHYLRDKGGNIYVYRNGIYDTLEKDDNIKILSQYIKNGYRTMHALSNAHSLMQAYIPLTDDDTDDTYIAMQNGLYNIHTRKMESFSPDKIYFRKLTFDYKNGVETPNWDAFLDYAANGDDKFKDKIQEIIGLALSNVSCMFIKRQFVFYSERGDTGKSIIFKVLTGMLGQENISNVPMQMMSDRFATSSMYNKRLNIVPDQSASDIHDISVFKQLTGGDLIRVEFKGKQPFETYYHGMLICGCNTLPRILDDKGDHTFKRLDIVPMRRVVLEPDRSLYDKLVPEFPGIFQWAMQGLERLINNGYTFTQTTESENLKEEYRQRSDTLYAFIKECCIEDEKETIKRSDLYTYYKDYCVDLGYDSPPIMKKNFSSRLQILGFDTVIIRGYPVIKRLKFIGKNPF